MAIVLISSPFQGGGEELASSLARKTGWPVVSRQELQELARDKGIRTGRLETSIIKNPVLPEKLAREKNLYLAFVEATLCERADDGNLIYHGRAGHLLLPGIGHRMRVGLTVPYHVRVQRTARTLNLSPDRAELYLARLDRDFERWTRFIHNVNGNGLDHYDVFLNLDHLGLSNAAAVACELAQMPDFRPTPASTKQIQDRYLAAQAKLRLAFDPRTAAAEFEVSADDGVVIVTYPPREQGVAAEVPEVLAELEGCRAIQCTMAETNILWVQERFDPDSDSFRQLNRLARRWGAAVELMRLLPSEEESNLLSLPELAEPPKRSPINEAADGGVEDDPVQPAIDDGGLHRTQEELVSVGRSAGQHTVCGGYHKILEAARSSGAYSLVVIGNVFLSKGHSARTRMTRELALAIRDRLKAPVITASELESKFMFGVRQAVKLFVFLALVVLIYGVVFTFQVPILDLLGGSLHERRSWLAPLLVVLIVPTVAYLYGTVAGLALKLINID